jgi:hypothetical protein
MILLTILFMDIVTNFFGLKEAWGYSSLSTNGIKMLLGDKIEDHTLWKLERFFFWLSVVSAMLITFFFIKTLQDLLWCIGVLSASWGGKFILLHQNSYNWTMVKLGMSGYEYGVKESKHTTSTKTSTTTKVILFCIGVWVPFIYLIYQLW